MSLIPRRKRLEHIAAEPTPDDDVRFRELVAVREIVRAFLTATRAEDVYGLALEHVCPLVGASFASVYLIDETSELMRLGAAHNWPARFRPFLGEMRVRLGFGASGQAAAERRTIVVADVFADRSLEDWQEVATEMGFRALVAVPLQTGSRVLGALTFYFTDAGKIGDDRRAMMRTVADQLAATAEKAAMIEDLRRTNDALSASNAELGRQNAALVDARHIKDQFLSNVSHELRTPLTAVMGYISLMLEEVAGPLTPAQRHDLSQVRRASDRLLELIDDLLELTTLKRGAHEASFSTFEPSTPLREALIRVGDPRPEVLLRVEKPPRALAPIRSDLQRIVKVLTILLSNAYKFTPSGEIRASVTVVDGLVRYSIMDTGIGIAPEHHESIFEEFRQLDGSTTRKYGGSGLGLSLARRLARLLGGDIRLASAAGSGSEFTLELPLERAAETEVFSESE